LEETIKFNPVPYGTLYRIFFIKTAWYISDSMYAPTLKIGPYFAILTESGIKTDFYICMYALTLKTGPYFVILTESGIKTALSISDCMYAPTMKIGPHLVILTESARAAGRALIISGICEAVQPEHTVGHIYKRYVINYTVL
jgi:hypothetical protein